MTETPYVNEIRIIGRLGADARIHAFPDGNVEVSFNAAAKKRVRNKEEKYEDRTTWFKVRWRVIKPSDARKAYWAEALKLGACVTVRGEAGLDTWVSTEGDPRHDLMIIADDVQLTARAVVKAEPAPTPQESTASPLPAANGRQILVPAATATGRDAF